MDKRLWVGVVSIFPEMFRAISDYGITSRAVKQGLLTLACWNPRDYTEDRHQTVDDRPFGGGPGMVMEWSIGDYVLSGGELPAMVLVDAVTRLLPGALGHADSAEEDSFTDGLLDCPHYTRPEVYADKRVPEVLLSGNHEHIRRWRLQQALGRTWERRADLLDSRSLSGEEQKLLAEYIRQRDDS